MTTYTKSGSFGFAGGGKSGAIVDLWAASRFGSFPVQGQAPPSGSPDAGPVTTGSDDGNPGGYLLTGIPSVEDYYVRIQYGGTAYWGGCPAGSLAGQSGGTGTGGLELIASSVLGSPAANFNFTSIPQTYNQLRLVVVASSTVAAESDNFCVQLNDDIGANYDLTGLILGSDTVETGQNKGSTSLFGAAGDLTGGSATANVPGRLILEIPHYNVVRFQKAGEWSSGYQDLVTSTSDYGLNRYEFLWRSTAAVTVITCFPKTGPDFVAGSAAYLYGIQ